jgi:methionine biosynthesis protein MetW
MDAALQGFLSSVERERGLAPTPMIREDFREILRLVRPGSRVLDVGCGEGVLLDLLTREKQVDGRGLEISAAGVAACMSRGLSVVQGDADLDLDHFPDRTFDYAVLSQTLQAMRRPRHVLDELLRIADRAVVSFPNFGHWRVRWSLLHRGRMPETEALPLPWWSTPNIHLCTLADFIDPDRSIWTCASTPAGARKAPSSCSARDRRRVAFAGADAQGLFQVHDEHLAVADLAGVGGALQGLDHRARPRRWARRSPA